MDDIDYIRKFYDSEAFTKEAWEMLLDKFKEYGLDPRREYPFEGIDLDPIDFIDDVEQYSDHCIEAYGSPVLPLWYGESDDDDEDSVELSTHHGEVVITSSSTYITPFANCVTGCIDSGVNQTLSWECSGGQDA